MLGIDPTYEACVRWVMGQFPAADEACKDASWFFYGGDGRGLEPFLVQPDALLPGSVVTDAIAAVEQEKERDLYRPKGAKYAARDASSSAKKIPMATGSIPSPSKFAYPRQSART